MTRRRNVKSADKAAGPLPSADRKHLTESEVDALVKAAGSTRHGTRDRLMCLMMFRHGLRVSELCGIRVTDVDMEAGFITVRRLKGSRESNQRLSGQVMRLLRAYRRERDENKIGHRELFLSERGDPFTRQGLNYLVDQWGRLAGLPFKVHPHMLRHSCGYALVNRENGSKDLRLIQDLLGHKDPRHTAQYTALAANRFDDLWGD